MDAFPAGPAFRLLGPVEAVVDGAAVSFARPQHRDLLGLLLLHPNQVLTMEQILEGMWGTTPPATARAQAQNMVSALRGSLPGDRCAIRRDRTGYRLETDEAYVDASVFGRLLSQCRADTPPPQAVERLRDALRLWRGSPLAGTRAPYATGARAGLEERRLLALERLFEAELALGHHREVVPELYAAVAEHPFRERLAGQLMTALFRCGRQAEALDAYRRVRSRLVDEHGLDPSPALRELEHLVLTRDPALNSPGPATPVDMAPRAGTPVEVAAAAAVPPSAPRHRVPRPPAHLVGRSAELARVTGVLGGTMRDETSGGHRGARVAIYGPPGVGKTALALTAADQLQALCPDGQLLVDLGGAARTAPARDLLAFLLRALGVQSNAVPDDEAERVILLRGLVGGARLLLLLDDVAGEAQVRPVLSARWSAVIITSRVRLAALEDTEHVRLRVLPEPDALQLLAVTAPDQVGADPVGADKIVAACGGLPLAVRLAGAKLAARPHWTTGRLAARLADERRRLDELRVGDHAVRASFEASYSMLEEPAQRLFRALGCLGRVGVEPWLAAAALGVSEAEVADPLEDLVTAQLLDVTPSSSTEYTMHDLLRVFARERFDAVERAGQRADVVRRVAHAGLDRLRERIGA